MAAYQRVYDSRHLQADCQAPGSAPEPYIRQSSMGYVYLFLHTVKLQTFHTGQPVSANTPANKWKFLLEQSFSTT